MSGISTKLIVTARYIQRPPLQRNLYIPFRTILNNNRANGAKIAERPNHPDCCEPFARHAACAVWGAGLVDRMAENQENQMRLTLKNYRFRDCIWDALRTTLDIDPAHVRISSDSIQVWIENRSQRALILRVARSALPANENLNWSCC